ncbi:hypothetical protein ACFLV2_01545, partial [Chloroflexota bacterium]
VDAVSPAPGLLTIAALSRVVLSQNLLSEKEGKDGPTANQEAYIRRIMRGHPELFEVRRIRGQWYFRLLDQ